MSLNRPDFRSIDEHDVAVPVVVQTLAIFLAAADKSLDLNYHSIESQSSPSLDRDRKKFLRDFLRAVDS